MKLIELRRPDELAGAFAVVKDLLPDLEEEKFLDSSLKLISNGYLIFALKENEEIVSFARVRKSLNLSGRKFIWIYTFVTKKEKRRRGYGTKLVAFLEEFARKSNCEEVRLHTSEFRKEAHIFWEKLGFKSSVMVFNKRITQYDDN